MVVNFIAAEIINYTEFVLLSVFSQNLPSTKWQPSIEFFKGPFLFLLLQPNAVMLSVYLVVFFLQNITKFIDANKSTLDHSLLGKIKIYVARFNGVA